MDRMTTPWVTVQFERTAPKGDIRLTVGLAARPDGFVFAWTVTTPLCELYGEAVELGTAFKHAEWSADLPCGAKGAWVGTTWESHDTEGGERVVRRVRRVKGKYIGTVFAVAKDGTVTPIGPEFITTRLDDAMSATMGLGAGEERAS